LTGKFRGAVGIFFLKTPSKFNKFSQKGGGGFGCQTPKYAPAAA